VDLFLRGDDSATQYRHPHRLDRIPALSVPVVCYRHEHNDCHPLYDKLHHNVMHF